MDSISSQKSGTFAVVVAIVMSCFLGNQSVADAASLSAAEQQEMLVIHNSLRAGEGSSNMQIMTWDSTLALIAQNWSDGCLYGHGLGINSSLLTDLNMGQNIYAKSAGPANLTEAVMKWFNEKADFDLSSNTCASGKFCGHYTQVVWADSNRVGCGSTICPQLTGTSWTNAVYIVCNYGPGGNVDGVVPLLVGPACTKCSSGSFYCNQGLCDSSCTAPSANCVCKAACQNCNTQTADCRCQCGTGWTGVDCSAVCTNFSSTCGNGWPQNWCNDSAYPYVAEKCPAFCGKCVSGIPAACQTSTVNPSGSTTTTSNPSMSTTPSKSPVSPSSIPRRRKAPARKTCLKVTSSNTIMVSDPTSSKLNVIAEFEYGARFVSLGRTKVSADGTSWWKVKSVSSRKVGWIKATDLARSKRTRSGKGKKSRSRFNKC